MTNKIRFFILFIFVAGILVGQFFPLKPVNAKSTIKREKKPDYSFQTCINTFNPDQIEKSANGFMYWYVRKELSHGLNLKLSEVKPHTAHHGAHSHPEKEIYFVLSGTAELTFNGQSKIVGKNTAMYCPPNISHGIRNAGDTPLQYFVIKSN